MANAAQKHGQQVFGEINITPLTDIFLVLLIIMMVVAPMMLKARQDIRPPSITGGGTLDQKWLTIEVGADGRYYLDGDEVPVDALRDAFAARLPMLQGKNLIVRGDKLAKSQAIMRVFEAAEQAGFDMVTVAGESQVSRETAPPPETQLPPEEAPTP